MSDSIEKMEKRLREIQKEDHIKTDSLLKETFTHYIRMIGDADRKARIMLIVNSVFLTLGITIITKALNHIPYAWTSATLLICANLLSLFFSILSVRPEMKIRGKRRTEENILHYSNTTEYTFDQYARILRETMHDNERKYDSLVKDLYYYGNMLSRKYRLMKVAYFFFYWGIAVSVISYLVILLLNRESY
jgi:hypothetical protein